MPQEAEPIYDFQRLKNYLTKHGFVVRNGGAWKKVTPAEVTPEELRKGNLRFDQKGIFITDENGKEHQVFLYKRDYHLIEYGKPRFHICRCRTIDEFINSGGFRDHYMRTNTDPVIVANMDDGYNYEEVDRLPLCRNCYSLIRDYGANITSEEFSEILKQVNKAHEQEEETDLFGYTRDWELISREYREEHEYTCEECGLKIDNAYDRIYIHVHHINGDKLNNNKNNLKCLCLYCHANVDEWHFQRLTTKANKYAYADFMEKYGERFAND